MVEVAPILGYRQDPTDGCRWRLDGTVISINEPKSFDQFAGCGDGGAIDLVIPARRRDLDPQHVLTTAGFRNGHPAPAPNMARLPVNRRRQSAFSYRHG